MVRSYDALAPVYDKFFRPAYPDSVIRLLEHKASCCHDTWALDLGCGTCGSSRIMTRLGYKVVGLDLSFEMLKQALPVIDEALFLVCGDMRAFGFRKAFDVITCLNHGISYVTQDCEVEEVLSRIVSHLNAGGMFCFDILTRPTDYDHCGQSHMIKGEEYLLMWKENVERDQYVVELACLKKGPNGEWEAVREVHRQRFGTARHYAELAMNVGFQKVRHLRGSTVQGSGTVHLAAFR